MDNFCDPLIYHVHFQFRHLRSVCLFSKLLCGDITKIHGTYRDGDGRYRCMGSMIEGVVLHLLLQVTKLNN